MLRSGEGGRVKTGGQRRRAEKEEGQLELGGKKGGKETKKTTVKKGKSSKGDEKEKLRGCTPQIKLEVWDLVYSFFFRPICVFIYVFRH